MWPLEIETKCVFFRTEYKVYLACSVFDEDQICHMTQCYLTLFYKMVRV